MNEQKINAIVESVLSELNQEAGSRIQSGAHPTIPVEASARHVHLAQEAVERLFGPGASLTQARALSQPGEFLSEQRVNVVTAGGVLERVAILGPVRKAVQAELSLTDCRALGISAPVRLSGDLRGGADVLLVGPAGIYEAKSAAIVAQSHIHMTPDDAARFGVSNGQALSVHVQTKRPVAFEQVIVRVSPRYRLAMHIDLDEANACALEPGTAGSMLNAKCLMLNENNPVAPAVTEKVVTESIAKILIKRGAPVILKKGTILTPSARDVFSGARILIEYT